MLTADTLFFWSGILLFVHDFYTVGYAYFAIVIIQAAVRFGLVGSMIMGFVFVVGLFGAMILRLLVYDVRFSTSGYAFWTILMMLIALAIGWIDRECQRERQINERLVKEGTLLAERHRIARDLHDTVLKTLQGLAMEAYVLRTRPLPPDAKEKLQYIEGVCQRSSRDIRDIVYELRGDGEEEGIASQMAQTLDAWSRETGIATSLTLSGDDLKLPLIRNYNIRYVLAEALANVREHAYASHVQVSIEMLPSEMQLTIHDNGCGIGSAAKDLYAFASMGKLGVLGMKERVEQIGGSFAIEDGEGTRLTVKIPLASSDEG